MWTPLPQSLGERLQKWWNQRPMVALWQLALTILALTVSALLAGAGGVLFIFAFVLIYFFFQEPINEAISDWWDRRFWRT